MPTGFAGCETSHASGPLGGIGIDRKILFPFDEHEFMSCINLTRNRLFPEIELKRGEARHATRSHIHQQWSIGYVVSGITDIQVGVERLTIRDGQYLVVPGSIPHLCQPRQAGLFSFRVLYLPIEQTMPEVNTLFTQCLVGECSLQDFQSIVNKLLHVEDLGNLSSRILHLSAFLQMTQTRVIDNVLRDAEKYGSSLQQGSHDKKSSRYRRYYRSRKSYGVGPKSLNTIHRIERAKQQLIADFRMADIAQECGFYDQSHFTKTFKQYTGLTPSQFKEMC